MTDSMHIPVLRDEVLAQLAPHAGGRLLDATVGHGGHTEAYLTASAPDGTVVGLDADEAALAVAKDRLTSFGDRVTLIHTNFAHLADALPSNTPSFTHMLFDLGMGSHQIADDTRGFSFKSEHSLSMRYGSRANQSVGQATLPPAQVSALNSLERRLGYLPDVADILQGLSEEDLATIIFTYGEERYRGRIARGLKTKPYPTTGQELAERIAHAVPGHYRRGRLHPATRTFQALRLAVNRELESLTVALPQAYDRLAPGGKLAVISFHSLEDRIVKNAFRRYKAEKKARLLTKKPIRAGETELAANPRAAPAKMRVLEKSE